MRARPHASRRLPILAACLALALTAGTAGQPAGPAPGPAYRPGEILIRLQPGARADQRAGLLLDADARSLRRLRSGTEHWRLGPGRTTEEMIHRFRGHPLVDFVEPNYLVHADMSPDDALYPQQASLNNVGQTGGTWGIDVEAEHAWDITTGSAQVVVAVLDTGLDLTNPDLAANLWVNPGEIPANGIDDDGNGFVDDIHGWDFSNDDNDPSDDRGHGTHVSGIIGAVGHNGLGMAGVAWQVRLMPLKFLNADGVGTTSDAAAALDYATLMGADISNNSWGGGAFSSTLREAIRAASAASVIFVASAGNSARDTDLEPVYPAGYNARNVIAVAALDDSGNLASFSNFGATSVHVAAPGVSVLSTLPGGAYGRLSGTSMAAPHVSGAAALVRSLAPQMPPREVRQLLMDSSVPAPGLAGLVASGGRVSAFRPLAEPDLIAPGPVLDLAVAGEISGGVILSWTAPGDDGGLGRADTYRVRHRALPAGDDDTTAAGASFGLVQPAAAGLTETVEVPGLAFDTEYELTVTALDEWGNEGPPGNTVLARTLPAPVLSVSATSIRLALRSGRMADVALDVANPSAGTLDWRVVLPPTVLPPEAGSAASAQAESPAPGKGEPDLRAGSPVADGFGGPDGFGYRFTDSDQGNGPAFSWTDLGGATVVNLTGDDQVSGPIPLGFSFPFYGASFDTVYVHTNGYLTFCGGPSNYANRPIPSSLGPPSFVAPFWDDLRFGTLSRATYVADGERFILQFTDVLPLAGSGTYTFQVELRNSGDILFRYLKMSGPVDLATVGIQGTSSVGLQVAFNNSYLRDRLAVTLSSLPVWLTSQQTAGRLMPGGVARPMLRVDARQLAPGPYTEFLKLRTNDPQQPEVELRLSVEVGEPDRLRPVRGDCLAPRRNSGACASIQEDLSLRR